MFKLKIKIQRDSKDEWITFSHATKNDVLGKNLDSESKEQSRTKILNIVQFIILLFSRLETFVLH